MKSKLWVFRQVDIELQHDLSQSVIYFCRTASLLLARGVTTADEAAAWMSLRKSATRSFLDSRHGTGGRTFASGLVTAGAGLFLRRL